jgi:hypothetical protein
MIVCHPYGKNQQMDECQNVMWQILSLRFATLAWCKYYY